MHTHDKAAAAANGDAAISTESGIKEEAKATGVYKTTCFGPLESFRERYVELRDRLSKKGIIGWFDRLKNGSDMLAEFIAIPMETKWEEEYSNIVTTLGKDTALNAFLSGTSYTAACYLGLINASASSIVDQATAGTMSSHSTWLEVGTTNAPTYTAPRKTPSWSAAGSGSKSLSAAAVFPMTGPGTVGGSFLVFGSGASSAIDSTTGVLYSAGAFTGGNKPVNNGDNLSVSYTASL